MRNRLPAHRTLVIVAAIAAPLTALPRVQHMQISALVTLDPFIGPATMLTNAVDAGLLKPCAGGACMVSRRDWRCSARLKRSSPATVPDRSPSELTCELAGVGNGLAGLELWGTPGAAYDHIWNDTVRDVLRGLCIGARGHNQPEGM